MTNYKEIAAKAELLVAFDLETHREAFRLHSEAFQAAPFEKTEYHNNKMSYHLNEIKRLSEFDAESY